MILTTDMVAFPPVGWQLGEQTSYLFSRHGSGKCRHDGGIELAAALLFDFGDGLSYGPRFFVGPVVCQSIEHIGYGHDAPFNRNCLTRKAVRIAGAIPSFVVR